MNVMSRWWKAAASIALVAVAASTISGISTVGHTTDNEDYEGWYTYVDYYIGDDNADEVRQALLADIESAQHRIDTAIAALDDDAIEQSLIEAAERGVEVRVVADEFLEDSGQFDELVEHDAIDVVFGDGELSYLPDPNLSPILESCNRDRTEHDDHIDCTRAEDDRGFIPHEQLDHPPNNDNIMNRPADYNVMSHTFFLIDDVEVWNITAPLTQDQSVWPAFRAMSEELSHSYEREFRQMHGGLFATTLSVYNGPLKSITHNQPLRLTNEGQLRVRFNPQERLVKNVVDETLRARASVFIMTENLTNEDLLDALQYKQENEFEVRVLYGQSQGVTMLDALDELDAVQAPAAMGPLPTMAVFDSERDRNGHRQPRLVQLISHELWRAQPYEVIADIPNNRVRFYPSDTFADGVMWELVEMGSGRSPLRNPALDEFIDQWEAMWSEANDG